MNGLSSQEVESRKSGGLVNNSDVKTSRSYMDIFVKNTFTPFNIILFVIGALLVLCGTIISALSATGIIIVNIMISTVQEMRAKRRLDKIALLTRPRATVVRDGEETVVDQSEIVKDDVLVLRAGDQAPVDGVILECRSLEMDEALLTGESSTIRKSVGDTVYSGSNCIVGEGYYKVTAFGDESYASKMLSKAKKFTSKQTPLQMETGTITKVLMAIAFIMMGITVVLEILRHHGMREVLESFVLCLDVVPIALFLLITLTYMIAAVRMADTGVLLQRSNSVESISHVDTVCMDKTGTITTNNLVFEEARHLIDRNESEHLISVFATATGSKNRTIRTLLDRYGEAPSELVEEVQFSSQRKYSAVRVREGGKALCLYTGAWNVLREHVKDEKGVSGIVSDMSSRGLRSVVMCMSQDLPLEEDGKPAIHDLTPFAVVSIRDEVRPDCRETIDVFLKNGMDLKVISGDDPATVDALFRLADIPGERRIVSGPELEAMPPEEKEKAILETNIFGRMKPETKEEVIRTLKNNGRYVAMIGDGVNDVRSLKTAHVGVALESGSGAARGVADMILLKDNFSALPKALIEGRKTVSGMRDILKLYLTRNFALAIMFVVIYLIVGSLPMVPIQNTFYAFVSVSITAFFMTLFAKPDSNKGLILPDVLRFCLPSAMIIAIFGLLSYGFTWMAVDHGWLTVDFDAMAALISDDPANDGLWLLLEKLAWTSSQDPEWAACEVCARSAMVFVVTVAGVLQLLLVSPRFRFLSVDGKVNRSLIPLGLVAFLLLVVFAMYEYIPSIAVGLVRLVLFPDWFFLVLIAVIGVWFVSELALLKMGAFKKSTDRFEQIYMKKLDEAYTEGDVQEDLR